MCTEIAYNVDTCVGIAFEASFNAAASSLDTALEVAGGNAANSWSAVGPSSAFGAARTDTGNAWVALGFGLEPRCALLR